MELLRILETSYVIQNDVTIRERLFPLGAFSSSTFDWNRVDKAWVQVSFGDYPKRTARLIWTNHLKKGRQGHFHVPA